MADSIAIDDSGLAGRRWRESGRQARTDQAFASARRHSRIVRRLRRLIPVAVAAAFLLLVLAPYLNPLRSVAGLEFGPVSLSGNRVSMENPKLTGFRRDGKPYELVAKSATQDIRKPNEIDLLEMKARLQMESENWAHLTAATGLFDSQKEQMVLRGGVTIVTDEGQDIRMDSADIDFKAGTVRSREPVKVRAKDLTIDAQALDVTDNGKTMSFLGGVKTVVENSDMQLAPSAKPAEGEGTTP